MVAESKRVLLVDRGRQSSQLRTDPGTGGLRGGGGDLRDEALEKLKTARFDVVLTEAEPPGEGGRKRMRAIREQAPDSALVVVTSQPSTASLEAAAGIGIVNYVAKPIAPELLARVTAEAVGAEPLSPDGRGSHWAASWRARELQEEAEERRTSTSTRDR